MPNGISRDATPMEIDFYRVGNWIDVTLKYARSIELIRTIINVLVDGYESGINELITYIKGDISQQYPEKIAKIKQAYPGVFDAFLDAYDGLAKLRNCTTVQAENDRTKSVRAVFKTGDETISVGIDEIKQHHNTAFEFCKLVLKQVNKEMH